jgi:hypothetical protein
MVTIQQKSAVSMVTIVMGTTKSAVSMVTIVMGTTKKVHNQGEQEHVVLAWQAA